MFKGLTILGIFIILLIGIGQIFLPALFANRLTAAMQTRLQTEQVVSDVEQSPAFMMLLGRFDTIDIKAENAALNKVQFDELDLHVNKAQMDLQQILFAQRFSIQNAEEISLKGVLSEQQLAAALSQKENKLQDVKVQVTPDRIHIQGGIPLLGKSISVTVEGRLIMDQNHILFRMEKVDIKNALLGKMGSNLFNDLVLVDLNKLPFDVRLTKVEQEDGKVIITADNHKNE
ncbi:LmeA family phospholipid-binding protein [Propionispira raffinosivorans]|uniref:LmeA family phospholipid-binding protein n=1 Tax=Propionispira raffinosivorans TaxID=86959 RepID=UPI00035CB493|nr:DUF2993 domain-containing protein [Propionispira raffinosivorans]